MKITIIAIAVAVSMGLIVMNVSYETEVINEEPVVEEQVDTETDEEVDEIERARQELERINIELDEKEQELLRQREEIDAELERVRETRLSFT